KLSSRYIATSLSLIGTMVGAGVAPAQDFPPTSEAALYSITRGFQQTSLPLLQRQGTREASAVGAALLEKLCPAPCANLDRRAAANKLEISAADWSVQVMGDGTAARYQNLEVARRMRSMGRDPSQKM